MKLTICSLAVSILLGSGLVWAQHGHGAGGGGHMGEPLGNSDMGAASHGNVKGENTNGTTRGQQSVSERLADNSKLSAKLETLTGMPAQQACAGFKNLGQCVAAAHVSKNLNVSFLCLKSDMTGTAPPAGTSCPAGTGTKAMSLGKSIQLLSPGTNSKTEAKKATHEADQDIAKPNS